MDEKQVINLRQLGWLTGSLLTGGGLMGVQNVLVRISRNDSWLLYLFPVFYAFAVIAVFTYLARLFPKKHLFDINFTLFGRIGGAFVNAVIIVHLWLVLIRDISSINRFFNTMLLPRTPIEILTLLIGALLIYFGRTSIEVIARVNDVFFPLFLLMVTITPIALLNELRMNLLQPVMTVPFSHFISGSVIASGWFGDIFFLGAFLHMLHSHTHIKTAFRRGAVLSMFILSMSLLLEIVVFGPYLPGNFIYPGYSLVQQIHITDFLDRVDVIMLMIWFPVTSCKVVLIYCSMLTGISSFMKQPNQAVFNKPVGMLLVISSLTAFRSTTEVFSFGNYSSVAIVFGYQPLVCILLCLLAKRYEKKNGLEGRQKTNERQPQTGGPQRSQGFWAKVSSRYSVTTWSRMTNGTIACMLLVVAVGYWFGRSRPLIGTACGMLYMLGVTVVLLSTFAEAKMAVSRK